MNERLFLLIVLSIFHISGNNRTIFKIFGAIQLILRTVFKCFLNFNVDFTASEGNLCQPNLKKKYSVNSMLLRSNLLFLLLRNLSIVYKKKMLE